MKFRNRAFILVCLGIFSIVGQQSFIHAMEINDVFSENQKKKKIFDRIEQLGKRTGSYRAEVKTIEQRNGTQRVTQGKIKFKWPNMYWDENWRLKDGIHLGNSISNGKIEWVYIPRVKVALKYDRSALDNDAQQKGWLSTAELDEASLLYVGKESIEGEEFYVIEGEPSAFTKHDNPEPLGKSRFYISTIDGIVRKIVIFDPQGQIVTTQTRFNIKLDATISEKDFEFTPPEGTKIHEVKDVGPRINPEK